MNEVVLVTGGAGYIGSHVCKELRRVGYLPVTYDNLSNGHEWAVKWGPLEHGDTRDRNRLLQVMAKYNPMAVIHMAALCYVGESVKNPLEYYNNNCGGSLVLLDAMLESAIPYIVFSSTCAVYGIPERIPISEDAPRNPVNPYGWSKHFVETLLTDMDTSDDLKSVSLRYFNAAGCDPAGEVGEDHNPETHLIPLVLEAATSHRSAFSVNGTKYATSDGTCVRDFVHVTDLAEAHVKALKYLCSGGMTLALNLGTGNGYSVKQVIDATKRITGSNFKVTDGPPRPGDPPELIANPAQASQILNWKPKYSDLDTIINTALYWRKLRISHLGREVVGN